MLSGLPGWLLALALLAGVALDAWWGEPRRWHPLVGFGRLAQALEARINRGRAGVRRGALGWALLVLPPVAVLALGLAALPANRGGLALAVAVHALTLYAALGLRSLGEHTLSIAQALDAGQLTLARQRTRWIVSRDTDQASPDELAKAAVESLLENGNDAVFATLFWFAVAGGPGALLFRLANTLDAMWGYRSARFNRVWPLRCPAGRRAELPAGPADRRQLRAAGPHPASLAVLAQPGTGLAQPERRPGDGRWRGRAGGATGRAGPLRRRGRISPAAG